MSRLQRVAVLDTDMHHGQGSQEIFYQRGDVLNVLIHGAHEAVFFEKLELTLAALKGFSADALVLSLGFEIYERDPQSKVAVTRVWREVVSR